MQGLKMPPAELRTVCWVPTWNARRPDIGLEHALVTTSTADSVVLAIDDDGAPFRLTYRLEWDERSQLRRADLEARKGTLARSLSLRVDGAGRWTGTDGEHLVHLDGCTDIDIWPSPLTNSLPLWRSGLQIGERREFRMAWVSAPHLTVEVKRQAYTRLEARLYRFESLDESGFEVELPVDDEGFVLDYPGLFRRVTHG
jgi:uncharacterized protein